jgi:hypothetical protein
MSFLVPLAAYAFIAAFALMALKLPAAELKVDPAGGLAPIH